MNELEILKDELNKSFIEAIDVFLTKCQIVECMSGAEAIETIFGIVINNLLRVSNFGIYCSDADEKIKVRHWARDIIKKGLEEIIKSLDEEPISH